METESANLSWPSKPEMPEFMNLSNKMLNISLNSTYTWLRFLSSEAVVPGSKNSKMWSAWEMLRSLISGTNSKVKGAHMNQSFSRMLLSLQLLPRKSMKSTASVSESASTKLKSPWSLPFKVNSPVCLRRSMILEPEMPNYKVIKSRSLNMSKQSMLWDLRSKAMILRSACIWLKSLSSGTVPTTS